MVAIKNYDFVCEKCGKHEKIELAILRNVKEIYVKNITYQKTDGMKSIGFVFGVLFF